MAPLADSIRLNTRDLPQTLSHRPKHAAISPTPSRALIYLIPGNPGLIEYYRHFLTHLQSNVEPVTTRHGTAFTFAGDSLAGFHLDDTRTKICSSGGQPLPLNLKQQIEDVQAHISLTAEQLNHVTGAEAHNPHNPLPVILIGHSVGAYILMSLLSQQHHESRPDHWKVLAGICLLPTVVDLHASPNGRKARWLAPLPGLSHILQTLASVLSWLLPMAILTALVRRITRQPAAAAQVTAAFLASPLGVRQAVYLAQHELREMRADEWSDEVWRGSTTTARPSDDALEKGRRERKLFFYWGADDHWIANGTRDGVIAARAATASRAGPWMEIDTLGIPHDFCVREEHSLLVAEKVAEYVREALSIGRDR